MPAAGAARWGLLARQGPVQRAAPSGSAFQQQGVSVPKERYGYTTLQHYNTTRPVLWSCTPRGGVLTHEGPTGNDRRKEKGNASVGPALPFVHLVH